MIGRGVRGRGRPRRHRRRTRRPRAQHRGTSRDLVLVRARAGAGARFGRHGRGAGGARPGRGRAVRRPGDPVDPLRRNRPADLFTLATDRICRLLGADRVMLFAAEGNRLRPRSARGFRRDDLDSIVVDAGEGVVGRAFSGRHAATAARGRSWRRRVPRAISRCARRRRARARGGRDHRRALRGSPRRRPAVRSERRAPPARHRRPAGRRLDPSIAGGPANGVDRPSRGAVGLRRRGAPRPRPGRRAVAGGGGRVPPRRGSRRRRGHRDGRPGDHGRARSAAWAGRPAVDLAAGGADRRALRPRRPHRVPRRAGEAGRGAELPRRRGISRVPPRAPRSAGPRAGRAVPRRHGGA